MSGQSGGATFTHERVQQSDWVYQWGAQKISQKSRFRVAKKIALPVYWYLMRLRKRILRTDKIFSRNPCLTKIKADSLLKP